MENKFNKSTLYFFSQFWKTIIFIIGGALFLHCIIIISSLYFADNKGSTSFVEYFIFHFFSYRFIPTLIAFLVLFGVIYYFFKKTKKNMIISSQDELNRERSKAIIQASQKTAGIVVDNISSFNADIKEWILSKEKKGEQAPKKLIHASKNIELALMKLVEINFIHPYVNPDNHDISASINKSENIIQNMYNI